MELKNGVFYYHYLKFIVSMGLCNVFETLNTIQMTFSFEKPKLESLKNKKMIIYKIKIGVEIYTNC